VKNRVLDDNLMIVKYENNKFDRSIM